MTVSSFSVSRGLAAGRFKFIAYRQAPPQYFRPGSSQDPLANNGGGNVDPSGGSEYTCEGLAPGQAVEHVNLLFTLYDIENSDHVEYIRSVRRQNIFSHELDVSLPLYKIQNEMKMLLWSLSGDCPAGGGQIVPMTQPRITRRIKKIGIVIYPLMTQDELDCILQTVVPMLRSYVCFQTGESLMDIVLFTITPPDASLLPRLTVLGQSLSARFKVVGLAGNTCSSCESCVDSQKQLMNIFFTDTVSIEGTVNLMKLVQKLENKLMCMGNVKGLIVSSKMQSIFNRMQYIEEKYRNLQHHLMTETTYDGMLTDIDHIESKIKEVAVQIPLSYLEGNNLLQKIINFRQTSVLPGDAQCIPGGHAHLHAPAQLDDSFHIPGRTFG